MRKKVQRVKCSNTKNAEYVANKHQDSIIESSVAMLAKEIGSKNDLL